MEHTNRIFICTDRLYSKLEENLLLNLLIFVWQKVLQFMEFELVYEPMELNKYFQVLYIL